MSRIIDLSYFGAEKQHYHIYAIHDGIREEHHHDYYHLLYVKSGQVVHTHADNTISLLPGEAFLIPPRFSHKCSFSGEETVAYSLAFSPDLFHSGFSQSNIYRFLSALSLYAAEGDVKLKVVLSSGQQDTLEKLFSCLIAEQNKTPALEYSAAASLISASLYILAQAWGPLSQDGHPEVALQCRKFIDEHFMENLSIDSLCRRFSVSHSLLCSSFRRITGETMIQYMRKKRILAAESLIRRDPYISISEVSSAVGFSDSSSFFRNFTRLVGISPSRYRQSVRESLSRS